MVVENRGRLDDMVVDADEDHVVDLHRAVPLFEPSRLEGKRWTLLFGRSFLTFSGTVISAGKAVK
jgi:hypothetical protein